MSSCKSRWRRISLRLRVPEVRRGMARCADPKCFPTRAHDGMRVNNVSGLLRCDSPRCLCDIDRVAWSSNHRFDLFSQDAIRAKALSAPFGDVSSTERRSEARRPERAELVRPRVSEIAARSTQIARRLDDLAVLAELSEAPFCWYKPPKKQLPGPWRR
jgi:hypothetical protein